MSGCQRAVSCGRKQRSAFHKAKALSLSPLFPSAEIDSLECGNLLPLRRPVAAVFHTALPRLHGLGSLTERCDRLQTTKALTDQHTPKKFTLKALANFSPGFALKPWGIRATFISSQL